MARIEHLTIQKVDTEANLLALNSTIPHHFYFANDVNYIYVGNNAGNGLIGPIPTGSGSFVASLDNTSTIDFTNKGGGVWEADAIISAVAGNILTDNSGLFVKGLNSADDANIPITIDSGKITLNYTNTNSVLLGVSGNNLKADAKISTDAGNRVSVKTSGNTGLWVAPEYITGLDNSGNVTLSVSNGDLKAEVSSLLIAEVFVDNSATSLANWISSVSYPASFDIEEGDTLILTAATGGTLVYIHNGGSAGTAADFTLIEHPILSDAYIQALFSDGDGINFTGGSGNPVTIHVDYVANKGLKITSNKLDLDGNVIKVTDTNSVAGGGTQNLKAILDAITGSGVTSIANKRVAVGTGTGVAGYTDFEYDDSSKELTLKGDMIFNAAADGWVMKDTGTTAWKASVTTYGALVLEN